MQHLNKNHYQVEQWFVFKSAAYTDNSQKSLLQIRGNGVYIESQIEMDGQDSIKIKGQDHAINALKLP